MSPKQQSILLGGVVVAVLSTSYLGVINVCCCAGIIIGALVTVWHYTGTNSLTISAGEGALMGVGAAVVGGLIAFVLNIILANMGLGGEEAIQNLILGWLGNTLPPEQLDEFREQFNASPTMGERVVNTAIGLVVTSIFGAIGGAIGAALFKSGDEAGEEDLDDF